MTGTQGNRSYTQELHNYAGRHRLGKLEYDDRDKRVGNNGHLWTSTVQINGTTRGEGQGPTKMEARERAAQRALEALGAL